MPVMRPLIAIGQEPKSIESGIKIGTYDISILPYGLLYTVFLPKHPKTKPKLSAILESESRLNVEELVESALKSVETTEIRRK